MPPQVLIFGSVARKVMARRYAPRIASSMANCDGTVASATCASDRGCSWLPTWRSFATGSCQADGAVAWHRRQLEHELSWAGPDAVTVGEDDLHPSVAGRCAYPVYRHTVMVAVWRRRRGGGRAVHPGHLVWLRHALPPYVCSNRRAEPNRPSRPGRSDVPTPTQVIWAAAIRPSSGLRRFRRSGGHLQVRPVTGCLPDELLHSLLTTVGIHQ